MNRAWILLVPLWSSLSHAADSESVIKEMLRTSANITEADIRENYKTGCESGNTFAMRICTRFDLVSAELDLGRTYKKLLKKDSIPTSKQKLISAQTAWIKFRDLTCEYESNAWDGGMQGAVISSCKAKLTKSRLTQLKRYLNCTEPGCA